MPTTTLNLTLPSGLNRKQIRDFVISEFLLEAAGTGTGSNSSKYIYTVESLSNKGKILLKRPAGLNKGMDFTVHVDGVVFGKGRGIVPDRPKHDHIIADLEAKFVANPVSYQNIKFMLNDVFNCKTITPQQCTNYHISAGILTTEQVVMATKWLFIEQDVTYWNNSGRAMFYNALKSRQLC